MASFCPACNKKLKIFHIKAECPYCGANIPNHDWEKRLEEDALRREADFYKMHSTLNMLKFTVVGTKLRIARLVLSFLPVLGYVAPLACVSLSVNGEEIRADGINAITFFTNDTFKLKTLISMLTDGSSPAEKLALTSLILLAASLLFGVVAFFLIPVLFKKPNTPVTAVFHGLSLASYCAAPLMFGRFISSMGCSGSLSWGIAVGAVLFAAALAADVIISKKKVDEKEYKYLPKNDELQWQYAMSIGAAE